jgi:DNA replication protein DnaC
MSDGMDSPVALLGALGKGLVTLTGTCEKHGRADVLTRAGRPWHCRQCLEAEISADTQAKWMADRSANLMTAAQIPSKYVGARFAGTTAAQRAVLQNIAGFRDFILTEQSWGALIMHGKTGTGKTLAACQLAQSLISRAARSIRYITAKGMISEIQATYSRGTDGKSEEGEMLRFAQYDVLILDEIDALPAKDNALLLLTEIINRRYNENKPVIVISNQPLELLANFVGDRVHSRLYENSFPCHFSWGDYRKSGASSEVHS